MHNIRNLRYCSRVATQPGKIRKLDISPKNQGKVRESEKILRLETIFMPILKPNV